MAHRLATDGILVLDGVLTAAEAEAAAKEVTSLDASGLLKVVESQAKSRVRKASTIVCMFLFPNEASDRYKQRVKSRNCIV